MVVKEKERKNICAKRRVSGRDEEQEAAVDCRERQSTVVCYDILHTKSAGRLQNLLSLRFNPARSLGVHLG